MKKCWKLQPNIHECSCPPQSMYSPSATELGQRTHKNREFQRWCRSSSSAFYYIHYYSVVPLQRVWPPLLSRAINSKENTIRKSAFKCVCVNNNTREILLLLLMVNVKNYSQERFSHFVLSSLNITFTPINTLPLNYIPLHFTPVL